jgi:hypothetical protein
VQELYSCFSKASYHEASIIVQVSLAHLLSRVVSSHMQFRCIHHRTLPDVAPAPGKWIKRAWRSLGVHIIIVSRLATDRTCATRVSSAPPPDRKQNSFRPSVANGIRHTGVVVAQLVMLPSGRSIHPSRTNPLAEPRSGSSGPLGVVDLERCPMHYRRLPVTIRSAEDVEGKP